VALRRRSNGEGMIFVGYSRAESRRVVPAHIYQVRRSTKRLLLLLLLIIIVVGIRLWPKIRRPKLLSIGFGTNDEPQSHNPSIDRLYYLLYASYSIGTSIGSTNLSIIYYTTHYTYIYLHFCYDNIVIVVRYMYSV